MQNQILWIVKSFHVRAIRDGRAIASAEAPLQQALSVYEPLARYAAAFYESRIGHYKREQSAR